MRPLTTEQARAIVDAPHPKVVNWNGLCQRAGLRGNTLRKRLEYGSRITEEEGLALRGALRPYYHESEVLPLVEALRELARADTLWPCVDEEARKRAEIAADALASLEGGES